MNPVPLTLDNLKQLDFGKIGAVFNAELARCVLDCCDRPGDPKDRKVTIDFYLAPNVPTDSQRRSIDCDTIDVACEISSSVPKRRTQIYSMKPKASGALTFHPDLPREPDGSTMFDPATGEVKPE